VSETFETFDAKLTRLKALAVEPARKPMSRSIRWPTMAAKHIANEQEIVTLRAGLREAVALLEALR
jgi:hypothetical protein